MPIATEKLTNRFFVMITTDKIQDNDKSKATKQQKFQDLS